MTAVRTMFYGHYSRYLFFKILTSTVFTRTRMIIIIARFVSHTYTLIFQRVLSRINQIRFPRHHYDIMIQY